MTWELRRWVAAQTVHPKPKMLGRRATDFVDFPAERIPDNDPGGYVPKAQLNIAHQRGHTVNVDGLYPKFVRWIVSRLNHHLD